MVRLPNQLNSTAGQGFNDIFKGKKQSANLINTIGSLSSTETFYPGNLKSNTQRNSKMSRNLLPLTAQDQNRLSNHDTSRNLTEIKTKQGSSISKISLLATKAEQVKMYNSEARKVQISERKSYQREIMQKYEKIFAQDVAKM